MSAWLTGLQWAHPWAWGLAIVPLTLEGWWLWRASKNRRDALDYADAHLHPWAIRHRAHAPPVWRLAGRLLAGLFLVASLAGPRLPLERTDEGALQIRHAVNVMVVLDASPGMNITGAHGVSLLDEARIALLDLMPRLRGERLGLVLYGQGAGELLPCTDDLHIFSLALQQASPDLLHASRSTGLPGALALARQDLLRTPGHSRAVLLVAGADPAGSVAMQLQTAMRLQTLALRADGIPVFALLLHRHDWFSRPASALDAGLIKTLSDATGGATASLSGDPWLTLYDDGLARLPSNPVARVTQMGWRELYGIPLLGAMFLTLLLFWGGVGLPLRVAMFALSCALALTSSLFVFPRDARAQGLSDDAWVAWKAWDSGRYAQAWRLYAALPGFNARMGEGASAYRLGAFGPSLAAYRRAMLDADTDGQRAQALFNLGNAAFHIPDHLLEAIDAYKASLVLAPGNAAALRNLRLAQAQWRQEHPEREMVGIRKRGPASHHSHFGVDNGLSPSQMDHIPAAGANISHDDASLQAAGRLQTRSLTAGARDGPVSQPSQDMQPALRKAHLIRDHATQFMDGLLEQDNKLAAQMLQSTP